MQNQTIYLKKIRGFYFPIVIVLYLLLLFLKVKILILIFGLPLFLFFPGYFVNKILRLDQYLGRISFFGFSIVSSVAFVSFVQMLFRNLIPLSQLPQMGLVLGLNLILWGLFIYLRKDFLKQKANFSLKARLPRFIDLLIALIPLIFFIARAVINPYLADTDGAIYIHTINNIIQDPQAVFYMIGHRHEFIYHAMLYNLIASIGAIEIIKFAIPAIVWTAFISFYDFCRSWIKNNLLSISLYLTVLASAALTTSIDRAKPEVLALLLLLPSLILYFIAFHNKDIRVYLLGAFYAFVSFRVHETGTFLLFAYLIGGICFLVCYRDIAKKYLTVKNIILLLIIILPYIQIFNLTWMFKHLFDVASSSFGGFRFRWWFLDSYGALGYQVGWPGLSFIYYYFYNGILLLLFLLLIWFFRKKILLTNKKIFYYVNVPLALIVIFFIIAEILPRIGIYLLPDRAWIHVFYGSYLLLFTLFALSTFKKDRFDSLFSAIILLLVGTGMVIALAVTILGAPPLASRAESGALKYINNIKDKKTVIVSTQQCNEIMIQYYTNKLFAFPKPLSVKNYDDLHNQILDKSQRGTLNFSPFGTEGSGKVIPITKECYVKRGDETIGQTKELFETEPQILSKESKYYEIINGTDKNYPIYLFYSFAKTEGLLAKIKRQYWVGCIDYGNREFFKNLKRDVVYQDKNVIILKIR